MEHIKLNLSRKWRSADFQGIIGQNLVIKMLKNSLYIGQYFPVYLFAGQRGCGKTTTARVFATALNCSALPEFQKKPLESMLPCMTCASCVAMVTGKHPDFIEIDAASHTGVDNIRTIIETATLLPLLGHKKIYLIDEAHMLSKAAFNAFLKILEEPPKTALFILATTDPDKIIDTVRSRCFTLLFNPVVSDCLVSLLAKVCQAEEIPYEEDALAYIATYAQGSVRDALNILEQVRFAVQCVQKDAVLQVLGHVDDADIVLLLQKIYKGNVSELLAFWHMHKLNTVSVDFLWRRLLAVCRMLVWTHYGINSEQATYLIPLLTQTVQVIPIPFLYVVMEELYKAEQLFARSSAPAGIVEMILLRICSAQNASGNTGGTFSSVPHQIQSSVSIAIKKEDQDIQEDDEEPQEETKKTEIALTPNRSSEPSWAAVVTLLAQEKDPHLHSMLSQAQCMLVQGQKGTQCTVRLPMHLSFFADVLVAKQLFWHTHVRAIFGQSVSIDVQFDMQDEQQVEPKKEELLIRAKVVQEEIKQETSKIDRRATQQVKHATTRVEREQRVDVSDVTQWPHVNRVLTYFPGTVTRVHKEVQQ
jgi:DNA polymerase III subunit gamma/tau